MIIVLVLQQRSEIGKLNRQGMTLFHTTGSKSHARVSEEEVHSCYCFLQFFNPSKYVLAHRTLN
jgi:hypothetical protein